MVREQFSPQVDCKVQEGERASASEAQALRAIYDFDTPYCVGYTQALWREIRVPHLIILLLSLSCSSLDLD